MEYGERLAEGFEMMNGHTEIKIRPDYLRALRETEIIGALRDYEYHDEDDALVTENLR